MLKSELISKKADIGKSSSSSQNKKNLITNINYQNKKVIKMRKKIIWKKVIEVQTLKVIRFMNYLE